MKNTEGTLFTDILTALQIPHTEDYSRQRYAGMPFLTWFGLSKLLKEYGVEAEGYQLASPTDIASVPPPFVMQTRHGAVLVTSIGSDGTVRYVSKGEREIIKLDALAADATGVVMPVRKVSDVGEPHYRAHRVVEIADVAKKRLLWVCLALMFIYFFIAHGLWREVSTVLLCAFSIAGLTFSMMLMQKSLWFANKKADRFCGALEKGGCDEILKLKASTFFGIVRWSDVGFTYFSVTLAVLLLWPQYTGYLAIFNACCLPFTCWSIWYQRFRAHHWCTMCVAVQATLWCIFFCMLGGGWFGRIPQFGIQFFVIGFGYLTMLLVTSRVADIIKQRHGQQ